MRRVGCMMVAVAMASAGGCSREPLDGPRDLSALPVDAAQRRSVDATAPAADLASPRDSAIDAAADARLSPLDFAQCRQTGQTCSTWMQCCEGMLGCITVSGSPCGEGDSPCFCTGLPERPPPPHP